MPVRASERDQLGTVKFVGFSHETRNITGVLTERHLQRDHFTAR